MPSQTAFYATHVEPSYPAVTSETVIGLITPSNDILTELELRRMLHDDSISFSAARMKHHEPSTVENLYRHVDEIAKAGELFDPPGVVKVFAYACTSGSAIISQKKLEEELQSTRPGASLTSPMTGALRAFDRLGVKRIAMLTPYIDQVGAVVTGALSRSGISVCASASFHCKSDSDIAGLSPESIFEASCSFNSSEAEALFIPCTLLRTSSIIDRLEARLGKPVITANQAMLWDALRLAQYGKPIVGHGQLLML
ncbi:hypothetical protein [Mesorhizobium sp. M1142]|uniref:maleate cis-trans isomerase family protein n=1 Tax=Mesorhizobium sp. M1142 TaxID=2957060 RepID=UPI003339AE3E